MERISEHISYLESVYSFTAKQRGIPNNPSEYALENMRALADCVFEPLREWVGGAIKITSFYRSTKLNVAIGGSTNSQHCKGQAIDIDDVYGHKTNAQMFWWIANNLDFDQLIIEFPVKGNPSWLHISYKKDGGNRNRMMVARRINGRVTYSYVTLENAHKYVNKY